MERVISGQVIFQATFSTERGTYDFFSTQKSVGHLGLIDIAAIGVTRPDQSPGPSQCQSEDEGSLSPEQIPSAGSPKQCPEWGNQGSQSAEATGLRPHLLLPLEISPSPQPTQKFLLLAFLLVLWYWLLTSTQASNSGRTLGTCWFRFSPLDSGSTSGSGCGFQFQLSLGLPHLQFWHLTPVCLWLQLQFPVPSFSTRAQLLGNHVEGTPCFRCLSTKPDHLYPSP